MSLFETATHGEHAWFDASVSLLFFLLVGRFLDHRMRDVARSAAAKLMSLSASSAMRIAPDGTAIARPDRADHAGRCRAGHRRRARPGRRSGPGARERRRPFHADGRVAAAAGCRGFRGPILTVNPHEQAIRSALNYRSVSELPLAPDPAVIATPPAAVPGLIAELGARGCRAAVVVTAGFGEGERAEGRELRQAMLSAAKLHLLRIFGPNCLGFISPATGINASFAQLTPRAGDLAFITQSGALATAVLDWAASRDIGFSHVASLGDMSDVDFGDMLDYLALDPATRAILLYVESVLDRLLHHAVVIQIEGSNYRLRQHVDLVPEHVRSKALITPPPAPKRRGRPPGPIHTSCLPLEIVAAASHDPIVMLLAKATVLLRSYREERTER